MRLLFITPRSIEEVGGVEHCMKKIALILVKKGHHIDFLCTSNEVKKISISDFSENIRIIKAKRIIFKNNTYFSPQLIKYFKKHKNEYDRIYVQNIHSLTSLVLLFAPKERTVFGTHFHPSSGRGKFIVKILFKIYLFIFAKLLFKKASILTVGTQLEKEVIVKKFKIDPKKIKILPLGVSENLQFTKPFNEEPKKILFIGRFVEQKGVLKVIQVFEKLVKEYPNLHLNLVGSGPLLSKIKMTIQKSGLEEKVTIFQNVPSEKIRELYANADLFLMLSKYEAFGIAIAEAVASGVPTIAPNVGGVPTYIENNKNGILIEDVSNIELVAKKAKEVLSNNDLRNMLRSEGRKLKDKLSWENSAEILFNVL